MRLLDEKVMEFILLLLNEIKEFFFKDTLLKAAEVDMSTNTGVGNQVLIACNVVIHHCPQVGIGFLDGGKLDFFRARTKGFRLGTSP